MRFYLGTHEASWLGRMRIPLFVSHRRLRKLKQLPAARVGWALDSGGFTELNSPPYRWVTTASEYIEAVARYTQEVGLLEWAAPMDWMCEPAVIDKTGLSVREHQERTISNYLELQGQGPFIPVLQGWTETDYHTCIDLYASANIDLTAMPLVGLGTICRRQGTAEIRQVVTSIASRGISLHGFGVKKLGLPAVAHMLTSADSMAWSSRARNAWHHDHEQLCHGIHDHRGSCANCPAWALRWRAEVVARLALFGS